MRGPTVEHVAEARRLRADGLTLKEISVRLGVSLNTARNWVRARACVDCDAPVTRGKASRCPTCANRLRGRLETYWTRERLVAAIVAFFVREGRPPTADEWAKVDEGTPHRNTVAKFFGTWSAGIAAAGLTPRKVGGHGGWAERPQAPLSFSPTEELAELIEQQKRDSRTTQLTYDLSLDTPYGLAFAAATPLHQAAADEWIERVCERIDCELAISRLASEYARRRCDFRVIYKRKGRTECACSFSAHAGGPSCSLGSPLSVEGAA